MELKSDFCDGMVVNNILKMPERMEKGLKLVYPEKQNEYLDFLLSRVKLSHGFYIDCALEVMQALEDGKSVEEAAELIKDLGFTSARLVNSVVLSWSKRGPEFFKATLACPYEDLLPDTKRDIARIEKENSEYAIAEKKRQAIMGSNVSDEGTKKR